MMDKFRLRKSLILKRQDYDHRQWDRDSLTIEEKLMELPEYLKATDVLLYADAGGEVGTDLIFLSAKSLRKRIYYPRVTDPKRGIMEFYRVTSLKDLKKGFKDIREPEAKEDTRFTAAGNDAGQKILMVVPGVGFDEEKYRLGYGMGFYDRYLSDKPFIKKVALSFSFQVLDRIPHDDLDVPMDRILTETEDIL